MTAHALFAVFAALVVGPTARFLPGLSLPEGLLPGSLVSSTAAVFTVLRSEAVRLKAGSSRFGSSSPAATTRWPCF